MLRPGRELFSIHYVLTGLKRKLHSLQLFLSTDGIGWIVALAYLGSISFRRI